MIAHRLKTVRHADQIVVVDKGELCSRGTHEQLMKQDGIYKEICGCKAAGGELEISTGSQGSYTMHSS